MANMEREVENEAPGPRNWTKKGSNLKPSKADEEERERDW
jgi:hypothetical protein